MKAKFRCLMCGYEWEDRSGSTSCKMCGYLYVRWLNYDEMERLIFKKERKREIR